MSTYILHPLWQFLVAIRMNHSILKMIDSELQHCQLLFGQTLSNRQIEFEDRFASCSGHLTTWWCGDRQCKAKRTSFSDSGHSGMSEGYFYRTCNQMISQNKSVIFIRRTDVMLMVRHTEIVALFGSLMSEQRKTVAFIMASEFKSNIPDYLHILNVRITMHHIFGWCISIDSQYIFDTIEFLFGPHSTCNRKFS